MSTLNTMLLEPEEIPELRAAHYNAQVVELRRVHEELMIMRIQVTPQPHRFLPGQYTVLGLGNWETRVPGLNPEKLTPSHVRKLTRRAYSISCSMLDEDGNLRRVQDFPYLEFYITLVRPRGGGPPSLTPRLFTLEKGSRLYSGHKPKGAYVLPTLHPEDTVCFLGTGTGEAPHNAMLTELLFSGHRGPILVATCVRQLQDLAYLKTHEELQRRYANYHYLPLTTREPINLDSSLPGYIGKQYIQDAFQSGLLEEKLGAKLDPKRAHVFLCGNPDMIGITVPGKELKLDQPGMIQLLEQRGFQTDEPGRDGNIHVEKYW